MGKIEHLYVCLVQEKTLQALQSSAIYKIPNIPQCTLPPSRCARSSFPIFRGSGSETTSYPGSSPAEKGGFLQGRSLGTRLSMAMKSLIITIYVLITNKRRSAPNHKQYNFMKFVQTVCFMEAYQTIFRTMITQSGQSDLDSEG